MFSFYYRKEKHVVEKLEAQIEYEEAHSHPEEAKKLLHRIEDINEKAGNKRHAAHNDPVKVIHSGGHRHRAHHHNQQTQEVA